MPEKYIYKDKVLQRKDVDDAAKQSGMDVDTYVQKTGLKKVNDNYNFNGKTIPAEEIFQAAQQSKMGFDDYIQKAKIIPIEDSKKKVGSVFVGDSYSTPELDSETPSTSKIPTVVDMGEDNLLPDNPILLSKKYNELNNATKEVSVPSSGKGGQIPTTVPDEDSKKLAQKVKEYLGDIDPNQLNSEMEGISDADINVHGDELLEDRKQNPQVYQRKIARLKWEPALDKELMGAVQSGRLMPQEYDNLKQSINSSLENSQVGNYEQQRQNVNSVANAIKEFGGENKDKLLKNYAVEVSKVYGNSYNFGFDKAKENTPESKYLTTPEAQLGYDYIKDLSPEQAEQYQRLFIDAKTLKDKPDEQKGYNHLMQTLEETGIGLMENSVNEELNSLKTIAEKTGVLTPEQIDKATKLEEKLSELSQKKTELDSKYPDRINDKVDDAIQEILGQNLSWGSYAAGSAGKAFKNTAQGVWEAVSTPFMSDESNRLRELYIMGQSLDDNQVYRKTDENKALVTDALVISPELQSQIDAIKNDKTLSREQKELKLYPLLKNNTDKFGRVPIQGGKFNVNPSSILYGVTDLGTTLLPFIALEAATGGIGGAGAAAKFLRTFTAAAATSFHDEYANAILEGKSESDAYKEAMGLTAINSFAMAGAGTPEAVRSMAGLKTSAGKIISRMSDAEIKKVLERGTKSKALNALKDRISATPKMIKKGAESGAKFEVAMNAAQEVKGQLYNTEIDREEQFKHNLLNIANFSLLGGVLGHVGYKSPSNLQKSGLIEFGKNPDGFLASIEQMKKEGALSQADFDQRKGLIEKSAEAYKSLPQLNDKGKPLSTKEQGEILYNTVIKNEGKKAASTLPPQQAEKAEMKSMVADYANGIILENPTEKQLESRKNTLEKQVEGKDENGKPLLPEKELIKAKAQLEAVNDAIQRKENNVEVQAPISTGESIPLKTEEQSRNENGIVVEKPMVVPEPITVSSEPTKPQSTSTEIETPTGFKNRIHEGGIVLGEPTNESHITENGYTYRSVGEGEISAIDATGGVFPREGKQKGGNTNVKYWSKGNGKFFYRPNQEVIRVKNENISKGEVVSKNNLEIWDKTQNKFIPFNEAKSKPQPTNEAKANELQQPTEVKEPTVTEVSEVIEPAKEGEGGGAAGITQAANEVRRQSLNEPEFEKNPQSFKEWTDKAEQLLKDGYDVEALMDKLKKGADATPVENAIRKIYIATLDAEIQKNPTDALLAKQKRFVEIGDAVNRRAGQNLVSLKGQGNPFSTISDFYVATMEAMGTDKLTDAKKAEVQKDYAEVKAARDKAEALAKEATAKFEEQKAVNELLRKELEAKGKKAEKVFTNGKRDFGAEIKNYKDELKKLVGDYKSAGQKLGIASDGGGESFVISAKMAKVIMKIAQVHVEQVGVKIAEVTKRTWEEVKDIFDGITENDIRDVFAGKYNEKKLTQPEIKAQMRELQTESKLLVEYDNLMKGGEPKSESKKQKRNERLTEIREKIEALKEDRGVGKYSDESKVATAEKAAQKNIGELEEKIANNDLEFDKIEKPTSPQLEAYREKQKALRKELEEKRKEAKVGKYSDESIARRLIASNKRKQAEFERQLKEGDFEKKKQPQSLYDSYEFRNKNPKLYNELLDSQNAAHEKQSEVEGKLLEEEMKHWGDADWIRHIVTKSSGTLKQVFAGFDASAIAVQNLPLIINNPVIGAIGIKQSGKALLSQKEFDRSITELHNSSDWNIIKECIRVTEPKSLLESKREEFYPDRFKAIVKIKGKTYGYVKIGEGKYELLDITKPFERQFTALGNWLRVIKFRTEAEKLYEKGFTWEKNPEEFKTLGKRINNLSSSADIPAAYQNELTRTFIWSTRLLAAKLNMLGISDVAAYLPFTGVKKGYYKGLGVKGQKISRQQWAAIKDVGKFATGVMAATYLYAIARGGTVNTNVNSNGFLDVEYGDGKSANFTGGFSRYISLLFQLYNGGRTDKSGTFNPYENKGTDRLKEVAGFVRGKAPPLTASLMNLTAGKNMANMETDAATEASKYKMPLAMGQIKAQIDKDGASALFREGLLTFVGFNSKDQRDYIDQDINIPEVKYMADKGVRIVPYKKESLKPLTVDGKPIEVTDEKYDEFIKKREAYILKDVSKLMNGQSHVEEPIETVDDEEGNQVEKKKWSILPKSEVDKITTDELKGYVMTATTRANEKAIHDVFKGRGNAPKESGKRRIE